MQHEIDEIDIKIISALRSDGRKSYADLSHEIGVAESTIRRRLKRLQEKGITCITAILDPKKLGFSFTCSMRLQVKIDNLQQIGHELARDPHVLYLTFITGEWDILALLAFRAPEELAAFMWEKTAAFPDITKTDTIVGMDTVTNTFDGNSKLLQIIESEKSVEKKAANTQKRNTSKISKVGARTSVKTPSRE